MIINMDISCTDCNLIPINWSLIPLIDCGDNIVCNECQNKYSQCCICQEYDRKLSMTYCDFCKDGFLCIGCLEKLEDHNNPFNLTCPCCRSLLISHSLREIIFSELIYGDDIESNLIKRWKENFYQTDVYIDLYKNRIEERRFHCEEDSSEESRVQSEEDMFINDHDE